jgi:hypothetical protein
MFVPLSPTVAAEIAKLGRIREDLAVGEAELLAHVLGAQELQLLETTRRLSHEVGVVGERLRQREVMRRDWRW